MATLKNGSHETIVIDGVPHWGLRVWAGVNGFDADGVKYVARTARKNAITDDNGRLVSVMVAGAHTTFGNRWIIPVNTNVDVVPEYVPGERATKRADGRVAYTVFLSDTEYVKLTADGFEIVDKRKQRKQRRAKRKLAKLAAENAATTDADADTTDVAIRHDDASRGGIGPDDMMQ